MKVKRAFVVFVLASLFAVPAMAGKHSQSIFLGEDVRIGDKKIPKGTSEVVWNDGDGQVQVTFKPDGKKSIVVPGHTKARTDEKLGMRTFSANGVTYLLQLTTKDVTLVLQEAGDIK